MILQIDERYWEKGFHNFEENLSQPRHRWYPFKEGFSNQLVREAIEANESSKSKLNLLDPFGGSGTTAVTASLTGNQATIFEVNPFCAFASRVKCSPHVWNENVFRQDLDRLIITSKKDRRHSSFEGFSTFTKTVSSEKWLFNIAVIRTYSALIRNLEDGSYRYRYASALKLAAIKTAMSFCNAYKDGKALRYKKDWQDATVSGDDVLAEFRRAALIFRNDTVLAPIKNQNKSRVVLGDSRKALKRLNSNSFDLMVTSPPYLNSFDYSDVYRPELFLGGFISDNTELTNIRHRTVRSHVQVAWTGETKVDCFLLKPILEALNDCKELWSHRIPKMVEAYFHDLEKTFLEVRRVLKRGAEAWIVVSTSSYGGVLIPVDLILADIASRLGFKLKKICVMRNLRVAGQQKAAFETQGLPLRESLIILEKECD